MMTNMPAGAGELLRVDKKWALLLPLGNMLIPLSIMLPEGPFEHKWVAIIFAAVLLTYISDSELVKVVRAFPAFRRRLQLCLGGSLVTSLLAQVFLPGYLLLAAWLVVSTLVIRQGLRSVATALRSGC